MRRMNAVFILGFLVLAGTIITTLFWPEFPYSARIALVALAVVLEFIGMMKQNAVRRKLNEEEAAKKVILQEEELLEKGTATKKEKTAKKSKKKK